MHAGAVSRPTPSKRLAAEVSHWLTFLPEYIRDLFNPKAERIEHVASPKQSFIAYRTSRQEQPEALQGVHSDNVLLIVDEASGVPDAVYQAAGGSLSTPGAMFLLTGNPTKAEGYFHSLFKMRHGDWSLSTVRCHDSSRVDPAYIAQIAEQYGEESNVYRVRVLGEFPEGDDEKLIALHLIESAVRRDIAVHPNQGAVWGLDVARGGKDRTVLLERRGRVVPWIDKLKRNDLMEVVGWVKNRWDETMLGERPSEITVDAIGLGAGVADRLNELGLPAVPVNVAEVAALNPQAARLRDDLWLQTRDWFARQDVKIPDDADLIRDLQAPSYTFTSTGKYKVISKDEMRRQGFASPDAADALALTFAAMPATALYGSDHPNSGWNTRNLNDLVPTPMVV